MDADQFINLSIKLFLRKSNQQPSASESYIRTEGGKDYVVLRNVNGVLAVYSITDNDYLRPLKNIPDWVEKN
jgi:hypothetical protein